MTTRDTKHLHPVFRYWGGAANLYDASTRRVDWRVFCIWGLGYQNGANHVCRYFGTRIHECGKSRMSVFWHRDTNTVHFQYFGIHASLYGSPAREPGGFPYIKLAFGCFSPIWPTKRRRGERSIRATPPFHFWWLRTSWRLRGTVGRHF